MKPKTSLLKNRTLALILPISIYGSMAVSLFGGLLSSNAFANGIGVRGGGEVIDVDGTPTLRDLVERATFDCHGGDELIADNPTVLSILKNVAKLDWYFADELKTEMTFLNFCYTGPLYPLDTHDSNLPVVPSPEESTFVGFRDNGTVYLDEKRFHDPKFTPRMRAMLLIHETMHSYLSMDLPLRREKLFSMVRTISDIDLGKVTSRDYLYRQMQSDGVQFPTGTEALDPYRPYVEFVLGDSLTRRVAILAATTQEALSDRNLAEIIPLLASWDQASLKETSPLDILKSDIAGILSNGSIDEFKNIFAKTYTKVDPAIIASSVYSNLSDDKKAVLGSSDALAGLFDRIYSKLATFHVSTGGLRIVAPAGLQRELGLLTNEDMPLASIDPTHRSAELPSDLQALADQISFLINNAQWDVLAQQVTNNDAFYAALGWKSQKAEIAAIDISANASAAEEKSLATSVLDELRDGLWKRVLSQIQKQVSPADFTKFQSQIQTDRF